MSSDWSSLFCLNVGGPKIPRELQFHAQEYHVWQLWGLGTLRKDLAQTVVRIDASRKKESNEEALDDREQPPQSGHSTSVHHMAYRNSQSLGKPQVGGHPSGRLTRKLRCHLPGGVMGVGSKCKGILAHVLNTRLEKAQTSGTSAHSTWHP